MSKNILKQVMGSVVATVATLPAVVSADGGIPSDAKPSVIVSTQAEPVAAGPFQPTWQSLEKYQTPEWFRDAKFGIWAHWGPQCQPEAGDWYARNMYSQGQWQNTYHVQHFGPPSQFGFKDVIHAWKAEKFNPEELLALYKRAGAQYFFAMANHHDNFDLWDSKYQPWNSMKIGPKRDLIGDWEKATRAAGLKFGVSVHASRTWLWYETAQGADKTGPLAGVPYDGKLTKADGTGKWWDGLDPQDLYAQNHPLSEGKGASQPDQAYCDKFYNRTMDLINKTRPDLIYFDDTVLPLWPVSDAGLKLAAHLYNSNAARHGGENQAVLFGKILDEQQRKCMVWDIERGQSPSIEPLPWQSDTCLGDWHYNRGVYDKNRYKSAATVLQTLADVVSKNGNLLLSVPVRADGTIDEKERAVVATIADWMDVNREAIFGTRPFSIAGEGPQLAKFHPFTGPGFNEGKGKPATEKDVRFTTHGDTLYAITAVLPKEAVSLAELAPAKKRLAKAVKSVEQLGAGPVKWEQTDAGLQITPTAGTLKNDRLPVVFKIVTGS